MILENALEYDKSARDVLLQHAPDTHCVGDIYNWLPDGMPADKLSG